MRNRKGFTLIELMIAIAIIGILALVLIPRVAGLKDSARESGLDTNIRVGLSIAEGLIEKYDPNAASLQTELTNLETDLATKLKANKVQNPFTKGTEVTNAAITSATVASFAYETESATQSTTYDSMTDPTTAADRKGIVYFDAYKGTDNKIHVTFVPYDRDGAAVLKGDKTTN